MSTITQPRIAAGFSMIEMLVALLVLSIGLLGIAALQARGQQFNHGAYIRTQATTLAYEIMDRIRANTACADDVYPLPPDVTKTNSNQNNDPNGWPRFDGCENGYASAGGGTTNCDTANCLPAQLRDFDILRWQDHLATSLPEGNGSIAWTAATEKTPGYYSITVQWFDRDDGATYSQIWPLRP